jgi:hypothetical protein
MQKQTFAKVTTVTSKSLLASFRVFYIIAKCKNSHLTGGSLVLASG